MRVSISRVAGAVALLLLFIISSRSSSLSLRATTAVTPLYRDTISSPTAGKERIFIENVDLWKYDREVDTFAQLLVGNVVLRHKDATMYCDSAKLYQEQNRFEGFGSVRIEQGDSLEITCNYIDYNGMNLLARLRESVVMNHGDNHLYTDSLDYDRKTGLGYYFDTGSVADTLNVLSSTYGTYDTKSKKVVFEEDVVLDNPNFKLYTDQLNYDTETKLADIVSPSRIVGDSGIIYTSRGTYDTENDLAYLMNRPVMVSGTRWMTGDSLFYDRAAMRAEMYRHIQMKDTAQQVALFGNFAVYHEDIGYGFAQDSAYIVEYSSEDTLYMHAKLMEMIKADSVSTLFKGIGNARLYRSNAQAVADSIIYNTRDSVMVSYGKPFIWSGESQVTGDTVSLFIHNGELDYAHIRENAYLSSKVDEEKHFNQMRGREVLAYFSDQQMDSVWTRGNAEVIYYSLNPDSIATEHVKAQCSEILMQFKEEELSKVKLMGRQVGTVSPVLLIDETQLYYPDFVWFPEGRPTSFLDIFRETPKPGGAAKDKKEEAETPPNQEKEALATSESTEITQEEAPKEESKEEPTE
ncbi:OstA-like protein [Porphyromonas somerae]|uniref:OstA-like protein n=1 Tax=Porphyromonas somerae TaxID=322095 RepID=UPI002A75B847|nr:OstA-like protein [Porphyromonas somerae]